ncbi:hypothetical protein LINGRAHAP2_LOCUS1901, partial [Linum grandiflorum]
DCCPADRNYKNQKLLFFLLSEFQRTELSSSLCLKNQTMSNRYETQREA